MYGGVLISMAVVGTIVFASFQRPAQSQSTSPAFTAGPSLPSYRVATNEHIEHGWYPSKGKRGSFTVELRFGSSGTLPIKRTRSWRLGSLDPQLAMTGQYAHITGGGGRFQAGGHQAAWYARLFGVVSRPGAAKQRVVITLKGRPNGVFVLAPLEPGVLKRDSGTQHSFETGWRPHRDATATGLVQPARLELALLDPQVARKLGIVAAHFRSSWPRDNLVVG